MRWTTICLVLLIAFPVLANPPGRPIPIAHRGLLRDAPENTLAAFAACIDLRLGIELDVRRSRDGVLVVLHDDTVDRTTNGKGKLVDLSAAQLQKLDAGSWFDPAFAGQRVPTLADVFALLRDRKSDILVAMDLKIDDPNYESDIVTLARKYQVLDHLVFIGRTIQDPSVRKKLLAADQTAQVSVLAQTARDLPAAVADPEATWVYARFIPTDAEAEIIRKAGKKVFLAGPPVSSHKPESFRQALAIRADAVLTDYPLECRREWRVDPRKGQR